MKQKQKDYDYMFKIILVGFFAVGKSQILLKYTRDQFNEGSQTTIGVQYATKTVTTAQGSRIKLQIWDTAGQDKYKSLMKTYYKGASAALIVYDITNQKSFLNLQSEHNAIKQFIKGDIITMIVGNKVDLEQQRVVSKQRGLEFAQSKKNAFYQVSAKDGTNINLIFTRLAQELEKAVNHPKVQQQSIIKSQVAKVSIKEPPEDKKIKITKQNQNRRVQQANQSKKKCQC